MKLTPLNMYVLVKPEPVQKNETGFLVAETAKVDSKFGTVVDISAMCPTDVMPGDMVMYMKVSGHAFEDKVIIEYSDLLGVIKQKPNESENH